MACSCDSCSSPRIIKTRTAQFWRWLAESRGETADRVIVQYNGLKMEDTDVLSLFERPKSAYTRALLSALPENAKGGRLPTVSAFAPGDLAERLA